MTDSNFYFKPLKVFINIRNTFDDITLTSFLFRFFIKYKIELILN